MIIWAVVVLLVVGMVCRGGRHPRLLRAGIAYAVTSVVMYVIVLWWLSTNPNGKVPTGQTIGVPLAVALAVGIIPWRRLGLLMKYPSGAGVIVGWAIAPWTFGVPAIYMSWRYFTGHRRAERPATDARVALELLPWMTSAPPRE